MTNKYVIVVKGLQGSEVSAIGMQLSLFFGTTQPFKYRIEERKYGERNRDRGREKGKVKEEERIIMLYHAFKCSLFIHTFINLYSYLSMFNRP